jgi:hypothetical protein
VSRRRAAAAGGAALAALAAVMLALVLVSGDSDGDGEDATARRYAAAWQDACTGLRTDGRRTAAVIRSRTADAAGRRPAAVRRTAADVAAPYLDRTAARLRRVATTPPPARWRHYRDAVAAGLQAARARATAAAARLRRGDVAALTALDLGPIGDPPAAPADLRARTPACL